MKFKSSFSESSHITNLEFPVAKSSDDLEKSENKGIAASIGNKTEINNGPNSHAHVMNLNFLISFHLLIQNNNAVIIIGYTTADLESVKNSVKSDEAIKATPMRFLCFITKK
ncbi:hypothetical protein [Pedobacter sp. JY14-1]|uniref:hypothetical protein n=1 Tax=Pedobacter sp. JY14-1 TaxID=3034151 RepID=UPI0023E2E729|nr:hypothetical protein [Pedobacter sp. JY14-1]